MFCPYETVQIVKKIAEAAEEGGAGGNGKEDDMVHSAKMGGALKILERMVNQNAEDEIFQDFKYWEVGNEQRSEYACGARCPG